MYERKELMARKDEYILNLLAECPWWVSVLVSGIAFVFLKYMLPSIDFGSIAANSFAKGLSGGAPIVALVLLLPAPIAALNSFLKKRRRNSQKGSRKIPLQAASGNVCPRCGGEMVLRTAQKGPNPGQKFWGCSNFPKCRFIKALN